METSGGKGLIDKNGIILGGEVESPCMGTNCGEGIGSKMGEVCGGICTGWFKKGLKIMGGNCDEFS